MAERVTQRALIGFALVTVANSGSMRCTDSKAPKAFSNTDNVFYDRHIYSHFSALQSEKGNRFWYLFTKYILIFLSGWAHVSANVFSFFFSV